MAIDGSVEQARERLLDLWKPNEESDAETHEEEAQSEEAQEVDETQTQAEVPEEPSREAEAEEDEPPREPETDESEEAPETLSELAEAIEVEPEFLYKIKVPYTDGAGNRADFTLSEIKDSLQDFTKLKEERNRFEQDRQTLEKERQELTSQLENRLEQAEQIINGFDKQLDEELNSPAMQKLREDDPAEWAAKKSEINDRKRQLREQRDSIASQKTAQTEEQKQEQQQRIQAHVQAETQKLMEAIPEWKDSEKAKAETQQLVNYLRKEGLKDDEINAIYDHRSFVIARKAMLFDEGAKQVDVAKKRVKKLPKRVKPSSTKPAPDAEDEAKRKRRDRLKKTGDVKDAQAVILDRLRGK